MLAYRHLHEFPERTAERMMMAYGSALLLSRLTGSIPPEWPVPRHRPPRYIRKPKLPRPVKQRAMPGPIARRILGEVAVAFNIDPNAMTGESRETRLMHARAVAIRLLRNCALSDGKPRFSMPTIGDYFHRDHSTVSHSLAMFETYCLHHPEVAAIYQSLRGGE